MKAAVIDIGTNSCRLLIGGKSSDNQLDISARRLTITRLGEDVDKTRKLNKEAVKRVLNALKNYKKIINDYNIDRVRLIGTSALRDVNNPELLSKQINKIGFELEIITGSKEAELNYLGALSNLDKNFMLIDIGGGSTEFIWSENKKIQFESLDLGAVRLTEKYIASPEAKLALKERKKIENHVIKELKKRLNLAKDFQLKGVGGTITSLAAIKLELEVYESQKIENLVINKNEIDEIISKLSSVNLEKRRKTKGLEAKRADIIIAGLIILEVILKFTKSKKISVSDQDLLYGLLKEELNFGGF